MVMDLNELTVNQLLDLAHGGNRDAQFLLGSRYYAGAGVHRDFTAAAEWFEKASLQGHPKAQFNLGYMYAFGEGVAADLATAMKWYGLAAEQGLAEAQASLAGVYERNGQYDRAVRWYRAAADQGFASAQASLGFALSNGRGVPENEAEAIKYYHMAAEQGFAPAQTNLGAMYAKGQGSHVDPVSAVHWTRLAAAQGYAPAQWILGDFYTKGFGVPADSTEAVEWFLRGAVQGHLASQNRLAIHYVTGNGVGEDPLRAFMWFAAAAGGGDPDAAENKDRVPIDHNAEIARLINAAAAGEVQAQLDLASRLHSGEGIHQDDEASRYWLRRAAESGDSWSQTTYALLLRQNDDPAVEAARVWWLSQAAGQGDDRARYHLGLRQAVGRGTNPDLKSGAANLLRASLAGFEEARGAIETIKPKALDALWEAIIEEVEWPDIVLILGPMIEGHLDDVRASQENDDGSDDPMWLAYEREIANTMFLREDAAEGSLLDAAFGERVSITQIHVARSQFDGKPHAAVTINLRNVRLANGFPVYWRPSKEGLDAVASLIGLIGARNWVRWDYVHF